MGKILILAKKSGFRDPARGGPGPVPGPLRDPGIPDPGDPGEPRRGLRDPPPPPGRGPEGLFYINPSRRGPAVPQGVPPGTG